MIVLAIYLLPPKLYRAIYRRKPCQSGQRDACSDPRAAGSVQLQLGFSEMALFNPNYFNNLRSSAKAYLSGLHLAELP
jgi:hypothetical protein